MIPNIKIQGIPIPRPIKYPSLKIPLPHTHTYKIQRNFNKQPTIQRLNSIDIPRNNSSQKNRINYISYPHPLNTQPILSQNIRRRSSSNIPINYHCQIVENKPISYQIHHRRNSFDTPRINQCQNIINPPILKIQKDGTYTRPQSQQKIISRGRSYSLDKIQSPNVTLNDKNQNQEKYQKISKKTQQNFYSNNGFKLSDISKKILSETVKQLKYLSITIRKFINQYILKNYQKSNNYEKQFYGVQFIELIYKIYKNNRKCFTQNQIYQLFYQIDTNKDNLISITQIQRILLLCQNGILQNNIIIIIRNFILRSLNYKQNLKKLCYGQDLLISKESFYYYIKGGFIQKQQQLNKFLNKIFKNQQHIPLNKILKIFQLQQKKQEIDLQKCRRKCQNIQSLQKSKFINDILKQRDPSQVQKQKKYIQKSKNKKISKQEIKSKQYQKLKLFINQKQKLNNKLIQFILPYFINNHQFIDNYNPTLTTLKKDSQWKHLRQILPNYNIFQQAGSIGYRDPQRKGIATLIQPKDINQGGFQICYLLSAAAAIAQKYPQQILNLFIINKRNKSQIYCIKLFIDGIWQYQILDLLFPFTYNGQFIGTKPHGNQIWVLLLEKAWAKAFKTYQNVQLGYLSQGFTTLTGAPSHDILTTDYRLVQILRYAVQNDFIVNCGSKNIYQLRLSQQQQNIIGIFQSHAYTFLNLYQNIYANGRYYTLLKLRNPWGTGGYLLDWTFYDKKWTPQLRKQLKFQVNPNDGTFFISLQDFRNYFHNVCVCKFRPQYFNSSIEIISQRTRYYQTKFEIKNKGIYSFTVYLQSRRKFIQNNYPLSGAAISLSLGKIKHYNGKDSIQKIQCPINILPSAISIQVKLDVGKYILVSNVFWTHSNQHFYTITSYGPTKIQFTPAQIILSQQILNALS